MTDQKNIQIGTHGEQYGNWMSNPFLGMIGGSRLLKGRK